MADGSYKCHDCHMTFGTLNLLQKHKQKFCVGGLVGDPDSLRLRKGLRSADDPPPRQYTPEERVRQLQALKANREKSRDIRNLQERILLDSLEDTNVQLGYPQLHRSRSRLPLSKDRDVQRLQLEYEMLREKELVHNSEPGYGRAISPLGRDSRLDNYSPMSNTSMSIHLPDDDYQKYNPNQDAQLKQLAENHGRQMEYLQLRNRDLEKQKEDIQRRLGELGNKTRPTGGEDSSQLLAELRAQEERNQRALDDLKRQLYDINHQRLNIIEVDKGHPPPPPPPPPPPQPETGRKSYVYPIYYGNSMVAEISAIRQAYLQNGGNDPDILHQMAQMQAEAQNIEEQMKKHGYDNRHREKKDNTQITHLELENERLHRELMLLQEQNFLARERKKTDREGRNLKRYHSFSQHDSGHDKLEQFVEKYETLGKSMFHKSSPHSKHTEERDSRRRYQDESLNPYNKSKQYYTQTKPPYVPRLDLRGINDSTDTLNRDRDRPRPRWMERISKPSLSKNTSLSKLDLNPDFRMAYDRKYGRSYPQIETKSLYNPKSRDPSGSHKSIRTEIMDGVIEPRRKRLHMQKGSLSENDISELFRPTKDTKEPLVPERDKFITTYNVRTMPNVPADRRYETISLQQKEEMNPQTQNIISTVTYKQEKIKEKAKV